MCLEFQVLRRETGGIPSTWPTPSLHWLLQRGSEEDRFLACLGVLILPRCLGAPKEQK